MSTKWATQFLLGLILLVGLSLRMWGIDYGLPLHFYPDEQYIIGAVLSFASGNLHPPSFEYPSFLSYLTSFSSRLFFISEGNVVGLHLLGRALVATFGVLSILLTYWLGRTLAHPTVGLLSASLLAVYELHIEYSHYVAVDVPFTCFLLLTFCFLAAADRRETKTFLWCAAVAAGCAMSTKYTGAIAFLPVIAWIVIRERGNGIAKVVRLAITAIVLGALCFLVFTPYALLDWPAFMRDVLGQQAHSMSGHLGFESKNFAHLLFNSDNPLYSGNSLWATTNPILFSIMALGVGYGVWRMLKRRELMPGLLFITCIVGYVILNSYTTKFVRWILPFTPVLIILGSAFLYRSLTALLPRFAGYVLVAIALSCSLFGISAVAKFSMVDTRTLATNWALKYIPAGELLYVDPFSIYVDNSHWYSRNTTLPQSGPFRLVQNPAPQTPTSGYVVTSSYYKDRYWYKTTLELRPTESLQARLYYEALETRGKAVAIFRPGEDIRGPEIKIYAMSLHME